MWIYFIPVGGIRLEFVEIIFHIIYKKLTKDENWKEQQTAAAADDNQSKKLEKLATPSGVRIVFFRLRESKAYNNFKLGKHGVHAQTTTK
jgi:hypothetical protein